MNTSTLLTRVTLATTLCAACSKNDPAAEGDGGSTEGGTMDPASDASTGPGTTTDDSADGTDDTSTGAEPTEAIYAGDVFDFLYGMGIPDAVITVFDLPGIQTVSDAEGNYEIGPLPLDPPPIFVLEPSEDYLGSIRPVRVRETSAPDDVRLAQVHRDTIDEQIELLQEQEPAEADLEQSIIIVRLLHPQATGAVIELDPPPEPGTFYAPAANTGAPVLNLNEVQFSLLPMVVYFNIAPADPHTYAFTATHPERTCTVERPDFPTLPGHITLVEVSCPPN